MLKFLGGTLEHRWHIADEQSLQTNGGDWSDRRLAGWEEYESDFEQWRAESDYEALEEFWGQQADALLEAEGIRLDPADEHGRDRLLWAVNDAALRFRKPAKKRLRGKLVQIPAAPMRPTKRSSEAPQAPSDSFEAIVERLLESITAPVSAPTKESVRTALRFFREACGSPTPVQITRSMVADWVEMLAQRPASLPKEERSVPLPKLVTLYEGRMEVPRLSQKTLRQHLSALGAKWKQAVKVGRIDRDQPNPFSDPHLERTKVRRVPKGFSAAELKAIFGLPIFTCGERPRGGKGEASYWLPLLMLHTGARPEEVAQLLVDDIYQDPESKRWVLRITDEGEHPQKGHQRLKTDDSPRTFPVPQALLDLGLLRYRASVQTAREAALFPMLRPKGARGDLYPQFGQWWREYLQDHGVKLEGTGRQPMREFRHTWTTTARKANVRREVMAYIQGHKLSDAMAGDGYGDQSPLGLAVNSLVFDGFDAATIKPWEARKEQREQKR
jgi:integrase